MPNVYRGHCLGRIANAYSGDPMTSWANESHAMIRYRARAGVVDTLFNKNGDLQLLTDYFKSAFQASRKLCKEDPPSRESPRPYRVLDSFFTTLREGDLIRFLATQLIDVASSETPVHILLANPFGDFARARAATIRQDRNRAGEELINGLVSIWSVLKERHKISGRSPSTFKEALHQINANREDTHVEVRLYDVVPSGPMFIFPPFVLYGQFCSHKNSNAMPWSLIVQETDPAVDDLFRTYENEFSHIWDSAASDTWESVDVVFITALADPEEHWVKKVLLKGENLEWKEEQLHGQHWEIARLTFADGRRGVYVAVGSQMRMGMTSAAVLTMKALRTFRPRLVVMCGVCAAVPEKAELGDVIVAQDVYDYGSGKFSAGRLAPDYRSIPLDNALAQIARAIQKDRILRRRIKDEFEARRPKTELEVRIEPMASGAMVVADKNVVDGLAENQRKLTGIDMEAYGVMRAVEESGQDDVKAVVVKGVQDFADCGKNDEFREYAAYVSAAVARQVVERFFS